jgi:hypothetical protein
MIHTHSSTYSIKLISDKSHDADIKFVVVANPSNIRGLSVVPSSVIRSCRSCFRNLIGAWVKAFFAFELSCVRTGLENCQSKILSISTGGKMKNSETRIPLAALVYGTIQIGRYVRIQMQFMNNHKPYVHCCTKVDEF